MLIVKEAPESSHNCVRDRHGTVEGQLGDLCRSQLSVRVSELNNGIVLNAIIRHREHAVVSRLLNHVVCRWRIVQIDRNRLNFALRNIRCIRLEQPLALLLLSTQLRFDILVIADELLLCASQHLLEAPIILLINVIVWILYIFSSVWSPGSDELKVLPFEDQQADRCCRYWLVLWLEPFDEDEWVDVASPGFAAVHASASCSKVWSLVLVSELAL